MVLLCHTAVQPSITSVLGSGCIASNAVLVSSARRLPVSAHGTHPWCSPVKHKQVVLHVACVLV